MDTLKLKQIVDYLENTPLPYKFNNSLHNTYFCIEDVELLGVRSRLQEFVYNYTMKLLKLELLNGLKLGKDSRSNESTIKKVKLIFALRVNSDRNPNKLREERKEFFRKYKNLKKENYQLREKNNTFLKPGSYKLSHLNKVARKLRYSKTGLGVYGDLMTCLPLVFPNDFEYNRSNGSVRLIGEKLSYNESCQKFFNMTSLEVWEVFHMQKPVNKYSDDEDHYYNCYVNMYPQFDRQSCRDLQFAITHLKKYVK